MGASSRRNRSIVVLLALVATAIFLLPAGQAAAATIPNACVNSASKDEASSIPVTMTAKTSTAGPVSAGDPITLEEIKQELAVPANVFLTGYRLELLEVGLNKIPTKLKTLIRGTNTEQEAELTNTVETEAETTITDPTPGNRASGDETATPGTVSATYSNQTWNAGASGPINFREATVIDPKAVNPPGFSIIKAGILLESIVAGVIKVKFGCDPGNVVEAEPPSTITINTAPAFASVAVNNTANRAPTANAGPDQAVGTGTKVTLNGFESSDSSEESFALHYNWTQTAGPSVTLSGATTPNPSFTAPAEPAELAFKLEVCDNGMPSLCNTDEVSIKAGNLPPTANAGPDQEVASESSVSLNGSGSSDPNGDQLTYEWTQTAGPAVTLSGAGTATPSFTAPTGPTSLAFELEVCDTGKPPLCSKDSVGVTVKAPTPSPVPEAENKAPNTKLGSVKIKGDKVTFKFSSNEKGSTFLCKLDKKKFAKCKSPKTYKNLKPGKHTFQVKARDPQGKVDPSPAVKKFKIKR